MCVWERETEEERGGGQIINPHKVQQKMIADPGSPGLRCSASSSLLPPQELAPVFRNAPGIRAPALDLRAVSLIQLV